MTNFAWLRSRLHARAGIVEQAERFGIPAHVLYARLCETEWSVEFERLMRAGLVMGGGLRGYGRLGDPNRKRHPWTRIARNALDTYDQTGDLRQLVVAANMCVCEFVDGRHPNRHLSEDKPEINGRACTGETRV